MPSFGVNSNAPESLYTSSDFAGAIGMRSSVVEERPELGESANLGHMPLNALFHAETTSLLRAARANGGTLEGQEVEVHVDGTICNNCGDILPRVIRRLGNPTVKFIDQLGYYGTVANGDWLPGGRR